jgi:hypothetical protein
MVNVAVTGVRKVNTKKTYAVAIGDPELATKAALEAAGGHLAELGSEIDEAAMKNLKLKEGDVLHMLTLGTGPTAH